MKNIEAHKKSPNDLFATLFPLVIHEWGNALHIALFAWSKLHEDLYQSPDSVSPVTQTWAPKLNKSLERLDSTLRSLREELLLKQTGHDITLKEASDEALRLVRQVVVSEVPNQWSVVFAPEAESALASSLSMGRWEVIAEMFYIYEVLALRIVGLTQDEKIVLQWSTEPKGNPRLEVLGPSKVLATDLDRIGRWQKDRKALNPTGIEAWRFLLNEDNEHGA